MGIRVPVQVLESVGRSDYSSSYGTGTGPAVIFQHQPSIPLARGLKIQGRIIHEAQGAHPNYREPRVSGARHNGV